MADVSSYVKRNLKAASYFCCNHVCFTSYRNNHSADAVITFSNKEECNKKVVRNKLQ